MLGRLTLTQRRCTTELSIDAYVDPTNAIPDATSADYLECFREVLNSAHDDVSSIASSFQQHKDDAFRLEIAVSIQVIRKSRVMVYTFDLAPISVERIDVLEAKVKDLHEEVEALRLDALEVGKDNNYVMRELLKDVSSLREDLESRGVMISALRDELKALRTQQETLPSVQVQATTQIGELIRWERQGPLRDFNLNGVDGIIRVVQPGLYQAIVMVNHQTSNHNMSIRLMKGAECIQTAFCGYVSGGYNCTTLSCVVHLETTDQLSTQCNANLIGTSCLILTRLGKSGSSN
ncbi:hypothetical protein PF008_g22300 [Phytophthora fragariae]|uniref:Uncharacterized protein n=1 Tax=Phytophthora fragariae TaxID=53985 RepID=A0A6G0QU29_9STRA|nr:hypothetical protein PF008_g22300 [Phytophthora fragariae]